MISISLECSGFYGFLQAAKSNLKVLKCAGWRFVHPCLPACVKGQRISGCAEVLQGLLIT